MEKVLNDKDLFLYIINFIPKIFKLKLKEMKSVNKTFNENIIVFENENLNLLKCKICFTNKLFLPIQIENNLYCYDCYCIKIAPQSYSITIEDEQNWKTLENNKNNNIKCRYCYIKCFGNEWCYYHLEKRCDVYFNFIEDLKEDNIRLTYSYIFD